MGKTIHHPSSSRKHKSVIISDWDPDSSSTEYIIDKNKIGIDNGDDYDDDPTIPIDQKGEIFANNQHHVSFIQEPDDEPLDYGPSDSEMSQYSEVKDENSTHERQNGYQREEYDHDTSDAEQINENDNNSNNDDIDETTHVLSKKKRSYNKNHNNQDIPINRQLFLDLEDKTEEALNTFAILDECYYSKRHIADSGLDELMTCDCRPSWSGEINHACGESSDCINRLTSVECVAGNCNCGPHCQNERFQRKEYSEVAVIQTEKKGYGLRAETNISQDTFIYEYIGEVIDELKFRKRMVHYDAIGYKHFYFMMLQKGEYIDATEKGALGRFCNHSCNPNSYVEKWVVNDKLRMGIFAKRDILKGEEITFDYNVDRYGADAQKCYCGEPNCIGIIGGKTQTESVSKLSNSLYDALGIVNDDDFIQQVSWITVSGKKKRKKKRSEDDEDYEESEEFISKLSIKAIDHDDEVSKIMSGLLTSQEKWITKKLIERIYKTEDFAIQNRVIRMHGYQIFNTILRDNMKSPSTTINTDNNNKSKSESPSTTETTPIQPIDDVPETAKERDLRESIVIGILKVLTNWPKLTKNKISSSKIESTIKELVQENSVNKEVFNEEIRSLGQALLDEWSKLKMAYRIPKREKHDNPISNNNGKKSESVESSPNTPNSTQSPPERSYDNNHYKTPNYNDRNYNYPHYNKFDRQSTSRSSHGYSDSNGYNYDHYHEDHGENKKWPIKRNYSANGYHQYNKDATKKHLDKPRHNDYNRKGRPSGDLRSQIIDRKRTKDPRTSKDFNGYQRDLSEKSTPENEKESPKQKTAAEKAAIDKQSLQEIIDAANKALQEKQLQKEALMEMVEEEKRKKDAEEQELIKLKQSKERDQKTRKNALPLDKQWNRLFAKYVPNMLIKYEETLGHENLKECAREIVHSLTEKELKKNGDIPPREINNAKKSKIRIFAISYMDKVMLKYKNKKKIKSHHRSGDSAKKYENGSEKIKNQNGKRPATENSNESPGKKHF